MTSTAVDIDIEDFREAIVVGGGTCGLAICARLCENCPGSVYTEDEHQRFHWLKQRGNKINLVSRNVSSKRRFRPETNNYVAKKKFEPEELLVLDAVSDKFLGQWDNQFDSCQIPFLRSPMFFHIDPANVDGLVSYANTTNREKTDLMEIENVVGKEYSKHQLKKLTKKHKMKKCPPPTNGEVTHDQPGLIDINMRDWKDYYRPSTPLFHDHCQDIIDRYNLHNVVRKDEVVDVDYTEINVIGSNLSGQGFVVTTASGKKYGCKICVLASGHRGKINYPIHGLEDPHHLEGSCHVTDLFTRKTSFPSPRILDKIKNKKPTSVVVVGGGLTSAQIAHVSVLKGVDKVYFLTRGSLKIKHFDFHLDWVTKYKNLKKSSFYIRETDEERWQMIQNAREGGSVNPEYHKKLNKHQKSGKLDILKFTIIDSSSWKDDAKTWDLTLKTEVDGEVEYTNLFDIDYVYLATGIQADIDNLPFLQTILKKYPIPTVRGWPCLTDDLQWNEEIPLFVTGKNASLRVGPSSANLDGARSGAERIGWFVQDQKSIGVYDWEVCKDCEEDTCCNDNMSKKEQTESADKSSEEEEEELQGSFETRLQLASGQLNWYSLLQEC